MTILLTILSKYWKHLVIVLAITSASFFIYNYIYSRGFDEANIECAARMKEYTDKLDARIAELVDLSKQKSEEEAKRALLLKQDLNKLLVLSKQKPLTIIKEGKCLPSETFVETYNAAIDRVNSK